MRYNKHRFIAVLFIVGEIFSSTKLYSAPAGFGDRNKQAVTEDKAISQALGTKIEAPVQQLLLSAKGTEPPKMGDVEWLRISFEKAENEVLALFARDLPKIEKVTTELAIYEVRASGQLPPDYTKGFRSKLERILLTSKVLRLKDCPSCDESRLIREEDGQLRYETHNSDPQRPYRIATQIGVGHLLYAELNYTPEDLQLRVRLVDTTLKQIQWTSEYSTADVVKTRERVVTGETEDTLAHGDSLSRVIIGEIAFTTVVAPGVLYLPSINSGAGSSPLFYPAADLFIGEKYDRGRKRFGFLFGAAINMGKGSSTGKPLPFLIRIAPQFRYTFNPYNVSSARYSVSGELGALFSAGMVTAYVGIGPEITMMERFSVSLTPMYIIPASVAGALVLNQRPDGSFENVPGAEIGKFGGFAMMVKGNINW